MAWEDDRMCSSTGTMRAMDDWVFVDGISRGSAAYSLIATTRGMGGWTDVGQDSARIGMASLFRAACACATDFAIPIAMQFVRPG